MLKATIVRDKDGTYHIRISKDSPQTGGDVELIEILDQKPGESEGAFKERAVEFVRNRAP